MTQPNSQDAGEELLTDEQLKAIEAAYIHSSVPWPADAVPSLIREIRRLQSIVEHYPLSGDGARIFPGMELFHINPVGDVEKWRVRAIRFNPFIEGDLMILSLETEVPGEGSTARGWQMFSTRAAAKAAAVAGAAPGEGK